MQKKIVVFFNNSAIYHIPSGLKTYKKNLMCTRPFKFMNACGMRKVHTQNKGKER